MRLVFSCLPAFGHLQPMVPLAAACVSAGHEVLVATGPDMVDRVRKLGLAAASVGPSRREGEVLAQRGATPSGDDTPMRRVWDQYVFVHHFPTTGARLRASDLVPLVSDFRPAIVVHDVTDFAAPFAAAKIGVPSVLHSWGPPIARRTMIKAGRKAAPMWAEAGFDPPEAGGMYGDMYLDLAPPGLWPEDAGEVPRVQPLRPEAASESWLGLPDGLDHLPYDTTVHLTLGTVANRSLGTFRTVLSAMRDAPVNLVVTVGPDKDPAVLGDWPPHILIAKYIPIDLLLSRCDAVIDHGGSGTVLAALRHGLPQLIVPYDGDNIRNARLCEVAGAAVQVPLKDLDEDVVRAGVSRLLEDAALTAAARELADEIAAMPSPAEVVPVLERLGGS